MLGLGLEFRVMHRVLEYSEISVRIRGRVL